MCVLRKRTEPSSGWMLSGSVLVLESCIDVHVGLYHASETFHTCTSVHTWDKQPDDWGEYLAEFDKRQNAL